MSLDRYIYPAIFSFDDDGISVEFPDLPGCYTCGDTQDEAHDMARDALPLHLYGMEEDGDRIPEPSQISDIQLEKDQVLVLVEAYMPPFREKMANKAVSKTVTIPRWLDILAAQHKLNFSHALQKELKSQLGITDANLGKGFNSSPQGVKSRYAKTKKHRLTKVSNPS